MTLKSIEKHRAHQSLHRMGSMIAMMGGEFHKVQQDCRDDEAQEMLALYSDATAMLGFFFLELCERFGREGIPIYNMATWAETYLKYHGAEWDEIKKRRFDYLLSEYQRVMDENGGDVPEGPLAEDFEPQGRYWIQFERSESEEEDEE